MGGEWNYQNKNPGAGGGGGRHRDRHSESAAKCYECGEPGHFARDCHCMRGGGYGRYRSPSPRYHRSPSYGRRASWLLSILLSEKLRGELGKSASDAALLIEGLEFTSIQK